MHLLAELLENATSFSSPQTKVRVTATRLPDGRVMVEIHDSGIGMTAEDFADINHKLANPPTVDAAVSQRMGLFVVGRLADRHGIRVQLRPSGEQAGTTSLVMLPDAITHGGGGEDAPRGRVHGLADHARSSRPPAAAPLQSPPCARPPSWASTTRATRTSEDSPQLDPVGRSADAGGAPRGAGGPGPDGDPPLPARGGPARDQERQPYEQPRATARPAQEPYGLDQQPQDP